MKRLTKHELIDALSESMHFSRAELHKKSYDELLEHYEDLFSEGDPLFPNERDYDAEDEEGI